MNARDAMLSRLRRRKHETALEREFYCSAEEYQVDLDMIWYRDWLFVGHDCEVSNPGDYLTVQIGEYPVVVVRDRNGGLNAFHNSCRHRGSRICSAERGSVTRLVCPYHQWTYHLDGRLFAARDMGSGLRQDTARSAPCPLRDRGRLHLGVPRQGGAGFRAHPRTHRAVLSAAQAPSDQGGFRDDHRRARQLETRLGEQPRVLSLLGESPGTHPHLPGDAHGHRGRGRGEQSAHHLEVGTLGIDRAAEPLSPVRQRPIPHFAHAARRRGGELHHGRQGGRAPAAHRQHRGAGSRHAAAVSLPEHLEPRACGPRDFVPLAAREPDRDARSPPSGWCTRTRSRASITTSSG